jgi:hypothetical protein
VIVVIGSRGHLVIGLAFDAVGVSLGQSRDPSIAIAIASRASP